MRSSSLGYPHEGRIGPEKALIATPISGPGTAVLIPVEMSTKQD
jgi:hypothetical protein